jgi:hypothetical protein
MRPNNNFLLIIKYNIIYVNVLNVYIARQSDFIELNKTIASYQKMSSSK